MTNTLKESKNEKPTKGVKKIIIVKHFPQKNIIYSLYNNILLDTTLSIFYIYIRI